MKAWQKIFASLIFAVTLILTSNVTYAQLVRDKLPLLTYAEKAVPVYDEPDGNKKGRIPAGTSLVMVKSIREDGWAYGSYKSGKKKKRVNRWFRMSDLQGYLDFENYTDRAVSDTDAYRTRTSSRLVGRVASDEEIIIVAKRGDKWKIIFLADGGKYRMGWVNKTIFNRQEEKSSDDDGIIDESYGDEGYDDESYGEESYADESYNDETSYASDADIERSADKTAGTADKNDDVEVEEDIEPTDNSYAEVEENTELTDNSDAEVEENTELDENSKADSKKDTASKKSKRNYGMFPRRKETNTDTSDENSDSEVEKNTEPKKSKRNYGMFPRTKEKDNSSTSSDDEW